MVTHTRFAAVVFDMDGLLLDSERPLFEAWVEAARQLECAFDPELLLRVLGRTGKDGVARFRASLASDFPYERVQQRASALLAETRARGYDVKHGARELLGRLESAGVACAVASSTRRAQVDEQLSRAGLRPFFRVLVGGDEVEHGKPAPDIFLLAAERLAVEPSACLVFEDSEHGARAAIAAGMHVVIVPDLNQPSDEARSFCLAVLDSLAHTQQRFDTWFALQHACSAKPRTAPGEG
jgi:HAD superfamily hydrolase (TIGR01509 family)